MILLKEARSPNTLCGSFLLIKLLPVHRNVVEVLDLTCGCCGLAMYSWFGCENRHIELTDHNEDYNQPQERMFFSRLSLRLPGQIGSCIRLHPVDRSKFLMPLLSIQCGSLECSIGTLVEPAVVSYHHRTMLLKRLI
jgi:hypothetical protein